MSAKRTRECATPTGVEGFWPFKRAKAAEEGDPKTDEPVQWKAVLPSKTSSNESVPKPVQVNSKCSSSYAVWQQANAMRYNARLVASTHQENSAPETLRAHVAPVDLAEHSQHFAEVFNSDQTFQRDAEGLQCLPVNIETSQVCLHTIVGALYNKSLHLKKSTVEETLRTAVYLGMPCIVDACVGFVKKYMVKQAPLEVVRLGKEMKLASLVATAEECIVGGSWSGSNLQLLIKLLRGRSVKDIQKMLHSAPRISVSELEVIEVLKAMPEQPAGLAEAVDFDNLSLQELEALGRHIVSLPPDEHVSQFWSSISRKVLEGLLLRPNAAAAPESRDFILWEVQADLFHASAKETEHHSPYLQSGAHKLRMLLKTGQGLYAKPEPAKGQGSAKPKDSLALAMAVSAAATQARMASSNTHLRKSASATGQQTVVRSCWRLCWV
ncbi:hypothetical protein WJX73_006071 [Symbiochloris irregularis]|uniref:BTB domain-containing protein n=1 Tax=Symbiochloris irregularis TaxID=706552 RepID=A0AAW1NU48_9CHLO